MKAGERYMSRVRSAEQQPIQDIFDQINDRINATLKEYPEYFDDVAMQKKQYTLYRRSAIGTRAVWYLRKK